MGNSDNSLQLSQFIGQGDVVTTKYTVFEIGDINCDGNIDLLDVQPFVDLLTTGQFESKADINSDGAIDLLDVQPFVSLLVG